MENEPKGRLELRYMLGDEPQGSLSLPLNESIVEGEHAFWELTARVLAVYRDQLKRRAKVRQVQESLSGKEA